MTDAGWTPHRISGTSAGALVGAVAAAGATGSTLAEITARLDYRQVADAAGLARLPMLGTPLALLSGHGLYQGSTCTPGSPTSSPRSASAPSATCVSTTPTSRPSSATASS